MKLLVRKEKVLTSREMCGINKFIHPLHLFCETELLKLSPEIHDGETRTNNWKEIAISLTASLCSFSWNYVSLNPMAVASLEVLSNTRSHDKLQSPKIYAVANLLQQSLRNRKALFCCN